MFEMSKNASQFYNYFCQLLEVFNPFWAKIKCPVYTADDPWFKWHLTAMFMADDFSVQLVFSASLCIICSWLWCQRVNTGWGTVAWVVCYWALQQLSSSERCTVFCSKNGLYFSYNHIVIFHIFRAKNGEGRICQIHKILGVSVD